MKKKLREVVTYFKVTYFRKPQNMTASKVTYISTYQVKKRMTMLSLTNFMNSQDFCGSCGGTC